MLESLEEALHLGIVVRIAAVRHGAADAMSLQALPVRSGCVFGAQRVVTRVVLRLLRRIKDQSQLLAVVGRLLPTLEALNSRLQLISIVGHQENVGHKLVSADDARVLEDELRMEIAVAPAEELAKERELMRLLWWCAHPEEGGGAPDIGALQSRKIQETLLRDSITESYRQTIGSRAVRSEARLAWEPLGDLLGGEEGVREVVKRLQGEEADDQLRTAVELAERYLAGWRPGVGGI